MQGYEVLRKSLDGVQEKPVFPRMTEVVMLRTFDIAQGQKILDEHGLPLYLNDSKYAFHINEKGVEKALGREYRFTSRAASDGELLEGIRAAVIDKDRNPVWRDDMDSLRPEEVAAMLAPLGENELRL